ncbi:ankyrin repeat domain-containing protein [Nitrosophilus alvini]|uniref:ankyrin repeat domain-containing protein n=1 Tax=Nitrosophilus alvini TaxID=2714855 RepID=UPI00190C6732|nr:ankyrin repeat domain-containing protein [Nitrosophilus alvini]
MEIFKMIEENDTKGIAEKLSEIEDINTLKNSENFSLLRYAVNRNADIKTVEILIEAGANIYEIDEEGVGILDDSIKKGRLDIVKLLVQKGIDPNTTKRKSGFTPLMAAVSYGCEDIVEYLLEYGVDKNIKDSFNKTAFDYARITGNKKTLKMLEEYEKS